MDDVTLLTGLLAYAALLMGFVFKVARDPPAWGQGPRRMTVWVAVVLLVAGALGPVAGVGDGPQEGPLLT